MDVALFIHSTGTGPFMWDSFPVPASLRKVAPANLGYPPGPPLARGTPCSLADDAAHALAALPPEAEGVHLVAHSYGGLLALEAARRLGPRVRSAWLYEPVLFSALQPSDLEAMEEMRQFRESPWFLEDAERAGTDPWQRLFVDYWNRPGAWDALPPRARAYALGAGWKMYQEVRSCFFEPPPGGSLQFAVPLTLVVGGRSPAASRAMARAVARANPHARLEELPALGHMAPATEPAQARASLERHLAGLCGGAQVGRGELRVEGP